jgi:hypothetical protein
MVMELRDNILMKIERNQNRVAHCLANLVRTGGSTNYWVRHIPVCISQLLLADCNPDIEVQYLDVFHAKKVNH